MVRNNALSGGPCRTIRRHPTGGVGTANPAAAHDDPGGRPRAPVGRGTCEAWLHVAPKPHTRWQGDSSSLLQNALPSRLLLHAANVLQGTELPGWEWDAASVQWLPPRRGVHKAQGGALPKWGANVR